eukprot:TRINITY_DN2783_c1_g1_i1.p1 TRINITY_DN2783_c1_g1~~TRINITY_DN2783_c1_g1_i1.p1  ORF type:complete len:632 (+),score=98.12 TRINITY_DN2783_c1_g1_i1:69-1964(+)
MAAALLVIAVAFPQHIVVVEGLVKARTDLHPSKRTFGSPPLTSDLAESPALRAAQVRAGLQLIQPCFSPPCADWVDSDGKKIEAHGAGLLQSTVDGRWYWFGESKKTGGAGNLDGSLGGSINCYSAERLSGPWKNEGQALKQTAITLMGMPRPYIVERPKVLFNQKTGKYVMWFHLDSSDYKFRRVGIATSKTPQGPYTFKKSLRPDGLSSLDMSLYQDYDGKVYFIRSVDNTHFAISGLNDEFTATTGVLSQGDGRMFGGSVACLEGFAMFRYPYNASGKLHMVTSSCDYWRPTPLVLMRSSGPNLSDPRWSNLGNPTGDATSFNSQPNFVVQVAAEDGSLHPIYMGDNWLHGGEGGLVDASYVWLPIRFGTSRPVDIQKLYAWSLNEPSRVDLSYQASPQCQVGLLAEGADRPKCWMRIGEGCKNTLGETNTPESWFLVSESSWRRCTERAADFRDWCQVEYVEQAWAPASAATSLALALQPPRDAHGAQGTHVAANVSCEPDLRLGSASGEGSTSSSSSSSSAGASCWLRVRGGCKGLADPSTPEEGELRGLLPCWVNYGGCRETMRPHYLETADASAWFIGLDPLEALNGKERCEAHANEVAQRCGSGTSVQSLWARQTPRDDAASA